MNHKINILISKICLIIIILLSLTGCHKKVVENHERNTFSNIDNVNQFIKDNVIVLKNERVGHTKTYILTLLNNSDYYINNINLYANFINNDTTTIDTFQNISLRPHDQTQLLVQDVEKIPTSNDEIYFQINQEYSDVSNIVNLFTLEPRNDIIYANDIELSVNVANPYSQAFHIIIDNNTDNELSVQNYDVILYSNDGNLDFPGDSYDYSDSDDYCIKVPSGGTTDEYTIISTGDIIINKDLKVIFSGGSQCTCTL